MCCTEQVSLEIRKRIKLSVAAYAYEFLNESVMSDTEFDKLSEEVDTSISTGNEELDTFFKESFDPCTGSWVHKHPEKDKLLSIYKLYYKRE